MRYQVSRGLRVVVLVPLIAFLSAAGSATAGYAAPAAGPVTVTSAFTYVPLLDNMPVTPAKGEQYKLVLTTGTFTMTKGDMRRVTDQLDIRIPSGHGSEDNNQLTCFEQGNTNPAGQISTGVNTNDSHPYQWNVSLLLVAPATGNYFCQIQTYASDKDPSYAMTVLAPAPGQTAYGTWLEVSSSSEPGAGTWSWELGTCNPDGTGTCQYIGVPGGPAAIDMFTSPWTARDDATTIDAVATFMITSCYGGTSSCPAADSGDGIFGIGAAEGEAWLDVNQLYPDGSVCQVNQAYSEESTDGQVMLTERYDISNSQHHRPLYFHLSAPVSQLCGGSRRFAVDLHIGWTAGNPVKIDGGDINAINSVRETTTTVPDVTGLTHAQAGAAIAAAGLTTGAPDDYVTSTIPPGTVLGQDSPAGTTEPDGSPVQLTVSLGHATVPDVIRDRPAAAVQAIKNAGLTAVTLPPISNCADPGTVQYQDPAGGAQAPPGSQVDIRVTACTR